MQEQRLIFSCMILLLTMTACNPLIFTETTNPSPEFDTNQVSPPATGTHASTTSLLPAPTINPVISVSFKGFEMFSPLDGWAWGWDSDGGDEHLWRTRDGGLTWTEVSPQAMDLTHPGKGEFQDKLNAWVGVCGLPNQECGLARTSDGGETWDVINDAVWHIFDFDIHFFNEQDGILESYGVGAGTGSWMLQETDDGGATWKPVRVVSDPEGMPPDFAGILETCNICGDILYIDPDRLIIVRGNLASDLSADVQLSTTTDRGQTWHNLDLALPSGPFARSWIHPMPPVFFNDHNGVLPIRLSDQPYDSAATAFYITTDGGSNWTYRSLLENLNNVEINYADVEFVSEQEIFVRCGDDLCITHDGADTWQRFPFNLTFKSLDAEARIRTFDFGDAMTGWALVDFDKEVTTLWQTTDGGKTWMMLSPAFTP